MADFPRIKPALVMQRAGKQGPAKSDKYNDLVEQVVHDVAELVHLANGTILPIFDGLGAPGTWTDVNPVADGLDGSTIMSDNDTSDTTSPHFWDSSKSRPKTVKETFDQVIIDLDDSFAKINQITARLGTAPTTVEGSTPATLAELESKVNNQTALLFQIQNSNDDFLTAAEIQAAIEAETLDPSSFHIKAGDIDANTGIDPTTISGVDLTDTYLHSGIEPYPDNFDVRDSILRLRNWIRDITGESFVAWSSGNVTSGTTLSHILASGTGTITSVNPHGQDIANFSDGGGLLNSPQLLASFDVRTSGAPGAGVVEYHGGYFYIPTSFTTTSVAMTLGIPGTTGLGVTIWKRTGAGSDVEIYSGLDVSTVPSPGSATASVTHSLVLGDMIYVSGVDGDGLNAKVFVFGKP